MCMERSGRGLINNSMSASVYCTDLLILHMLTASVHRKVVTVLMLNIHLGTYAPSIIGGLVYLPTCEV
jgi:hypothetical protein